MEVTKVQESLIQKVFIYKILNKNSSPHKRMEVNQKLMNYINENNIEIINIYEDHLSIPPSKRQGLKQVIEAYEDYTHNNVGQDKIDYLKSLTSIKVLVATDIDQLGLNILDSMEVLEKLADRCQVLFI